MSKAPVEELVAEALLGRHSHEELVAKLVTPEALKQLLVYHLQQDLDGTLALLEGPDQPRSAPAKKAKSKKSSTSATRSQITDNRDRKRLRLRQDQIDARKAKVLKLLMKGAATRRELVAKAGLETVSIYNRVMRELQEEGRVVAEGDRAQRVYKLK